MCGIIFRADRLGHWLLPVQANGSLVRKAGGMVIGSQLIGQYWTGPEWFHGRPSATTDVDPSKTVPSPYNAEVRPAPTLVRPSELWDNVFSADCTALEHEQPELAGTRLPADMLTTSSSGVDPDISSANAALQVAREARARGVPEADIRALLAKHITGRSLGLLGEPRVNVLALNLALREAYPRRLERACVLKAKASPAC